MYLLDTDHLTILERGGQDAQPLLARLSNINPNEVVATTIVTILKRPILALVQWT
jgi:tRNA(fMet)-specific endonuclease VapC